MAIFKQPNGLYGRYSPMCDCITNINMTAEIYKLYMEKQKAEYLLIKAKTAMENPQNLYIQLKPKDVDVMTIISNAKKEAEDVLTNHLFPMKELLGRCTPAWSTIEELYELFVEMCNPHGTYVESDDKFIDGHQTQFAIDFKQYQSQHHDDTNEVPLIYRFSMDRIRSLYGEDMYSKAAAAWSKNDAIQLDRDWQEYIEIMKENTANSEEQSHLTH